MTNEFAKSIGLEDEEMKEVADEFPVSNGLPEAPTSATVRVWIDGYGVLLK